MYSRDFVYRVGPQLYLDMVDTGVVLLQFCKATDWAEVEPEDSGVSAPLAVDPSSRSLFRFPRIIRFDR